jgi:predicted Na+-dependent transporter
MLLPTHIPPFSKIYVLLILLILVSTGGGTAYAVVESDPSAGLAIASFVLTSCSLILAFVAAGQWLGLSKPDSFSFAYNWQDRQVIGAKDLGKILGRGSGVI